MASVRLQVRFGLGLLLLLALGCKGIRVGFTAQNAFVPRLAAATRIAELERGGGLAGKAEMVALSKELHVASTYTSLLVLESDAMYDAFGISREQAGPAWTGEEQAESTSTNGETAIAPVADSSSLRMLGSNGYGAPAKSDSAEPARASGAHSMAPLAAAAGLGLSGIGSAGGSGRGRLAGVIGGDVYQTRWSRSASLSADTSSVAKAAALDIPAAEDAADKNPDNRTKLAALYKFYARAGQLDRADLLVKKWVGKDPLDPDATRARADLAARGGDRARALRIIGGVLDANRMTSARIHGWPGRSTQPGTRTARAHIVSRSQTLSRPTRERSPRRSGVSASRD